MKKNIFKTDNKYLKIINKIENIRKKKQCKLDEHFKTGLQKKSKRSCKNYVVNL